MSQHLFRLTLALTLAAASATGVAADTRVYRWVDADGRLHLSDYPPDAKGARAAPYNEQWTPTTLAQDEMLLRFHWLHAREAGIRLPAPVTLLGASSSKPMPRPTERECTRLWRAYEASQACYARFRTAKGAVKAEAFDQCGEQRPDPAPRCGLPRTPTD